MIDYLPLVLKTIITFLAVGLAVLSIIKDCKFYKKNTNINQLIIKWWLIFGIISAISIWLNPYLEKQAEVKLKTSLRPDVNIEINETTDSQIILSIEATHKNTIIKTLSLKFNIPGVFNDFNLKTIDRVGKCNINSSFQADSQGAITETVHVWCDNLSPNSFVRAEINYSSTLPRPIPGSENTEYEEIYMPVMDLHDYSKCAYTWLFLGEEITEIKYINLESLKFIQKDNENLLYHFQGIRFEEEVKKHNPNYENPYKKRFTKEWLKKLERDRKDW